FLLVLMEFYEELGKKVVDLISKKYSYLSIKTKEFVMLKQNLRDALTFALNDDEALIILKKNLSNLNDIHIHVIHEIQQENTRTWQAKIQVGYESEKEAQLSKILQEAEYALDVNQYHLAAKKYEEAAKISQEIGHKERTDIFLNRARKFRDVTQNLNFDNEVADSYLKCKKVIGPITVGDIRDITYIRIDSCREQYREYFKELYALNLTKNRYLIDLRPGAGGNSGLVDRLAEFLLGHGDGHVAYYTRKRMDENDPSILTDFEPVSIKSSFEHETKKVVVLFGPMTGSSGEITTMRLCSIPGSVSIGDISRGQSGNPAIYLIDGPDAGKMIDHGSRPRDHGSRFAIALPSWLCYKYNKELLQDNGIVPDILIPSRESIKNGRDLVLEAALDAF
nr:S41 family peptidase [Candidatus Sigynarchaeota archaeon]